MPRAEARGSLLKEFLGRDTGIDLATEWTYVYPVAIEDNGFLGR
jgi:hypothetical protein